MALHRYRDIVPDWDRFQEVLHTQEPVTFRIRSGRVTPDRLLARLRAQGFALSPVPGIEDFWQVDEGPGSVAQTLEHWLGLFHVQQAVMGLPTLALAPRPGERVLDLCAAPGGKTAHIAEMMQDQGPLVAVDPKEKRLRAHLGNLYRLGHSNVLVVAGDGRNLPEGAFFDRVLVDAPCSAEGNLRRTGRTSARGAKFVAHVTSVQEALLRRALALVRPGGTVVYSTCTFAPEENEAIVSRILAEGSASVERIPLDLAHAPGLTHWEGQDFHPDLPHAWRVYPHHLNSGGLFMVRLRRREDGSSAASVGWSPVPPVFPGEENAGAQRRLEAGLHELELRFGFNRALLGAMHWVVRGDSIWAHTAGAWPVPAWTATDPEGRWRVVALGIRALREGPPGRETPTSHFLHRWGADIGPDRQVHLSTDTLRTLLSDLRLPAGELPTGPVALFWDGWVLGRGMVGVRGLIPEIPRASGDRLRTLLEGDPAQQGARLDRTPEDRAEAKESEL